VSSLLAEHEHSRDILCATARAGGIVRSAQFECETDLTYALCVGAAGWDGGMDPAYFVAFKSVWCIFVGLNSVFAGFMSATSDKAFPTPRASTGS
jgi:hypothetical protein